MSLSKISSLSQLRSLLKTPAASNVINTAVRMSSHGPKVMNVQPSRFAWMKFKDMMHFYLMVGVIPCAALLMYVNTFIGPAQLTEIPEGYEPKHWEYHPHPITRWLARYIYPPPQQDYEVMMHHSWEEMQKREIRRVEKMVHDVQKHRADYQSYYYRPMTAKYHRVAKKAADDLDALAGDR